MLSPVLRVTAAGQLDLPALCAVGALPGRQAGLALAKALTVCGDAELALAAPISPADVSPDVQALLGVARCWVGPFALSASTEGLVVDWLDKGAQGVLLTLPQDSTPAELVEMLSSIPRDRAALLVPWTVAAGQPRTGASLEAALRHAAAPLERSGRPLSELISTLLVRATFAPTESGAADGAGAAAELLRSLGRERKLAIRLGFDGAPPSVGDAGVLHCANVSAHATVALASASGAKVSVGDPASVGAALVSCSRTDRADGLLTTVVCDEGGVCLGLVYSSAESLQESVRAGRGIYFSRSRGSLWRKGDTSGATQELVRIEVDCDSDALRFSVVQHGRPPSFCHLGCRTCWGEAGGLYALQRTLEERLASAPAGSYAKRLFDDRTLLGHKLLEEAQELIEATEPEHIAAEAADLAFFLMARCVLAGVTVADIERHLDRRALKVKRRPGLAKEHRIKAAAEGLLKARESKQQPGPAARAEDGWSGGWRRTGLVCSVGVVAVVALRALHGSALSSR